MSSVSSKQEEHCTGDCGAFFHHTTIGISLCCNQDFSIFKPGPGLPKFINKVQIVKFTKLFNYRGLKLYFIKGHSGGGGSLKSERKQIRGKGVIALHTLALKNKTHASKMKNHKNN